MNKELGLNDIPSLLAILFCIIYIFYKYLLVNLNYKMILKIKNILRRIFNLFKKRYYIYYIKLILKKEI